MVITSTTKQQPQQLLVAAEQPNNDDDEEESFLSVQVSLATTASITDNSQNEEDDDACDGYSISSHSHCSTTECSGSSSRKENDDMPQYKKHDGFFTQLVGCDYFPGDMFYEILGMEIRPKHERKQSKEVDKGLTRKKKKRTKSTSHKLHDNVKDMKTSAASSTDPNVRKKSLEKDKTTKQRATCQSSLNDNTQEREKGEMTGSNVKIKKKKKKKEKIVPDESKVFHQNKQEKDTVSSSVIKQVRFLLEEGAG
jgi:hypothetical protein